MNVENGVTLKSINQPLFAPCYRTTYLTSVTITVENQSCLRLTNMSNVFEKMLANNVGSDPTARMGRLVYLSTQFIYLSVTLPEHSVHPLTETRFCKCYDSFDSVGYILL